MRPSPRVVGALCAAAMAVTACTSSAASPGDDVTTDGSSTVPEATEPTEPSQSTSPEDPFAMPDPVTKEYVDRVVNTLYEEWGAITREILEQPADPAAINPVETRERIAALFAGEQLADAYEEADGILRGDRENLVPADEFGHLAFNTEVITEAADDCIVAVGYLNFEETAQSGGEAIVAISMSRSDAESEFQNATGWRLRDQLSNTDPQGNRLPDQMMIDASTDDFGDSLEHTCPR